LALGHRGAQGAGAGVDGGPRHGPRGLDQGRDHDRDLSFVVFYVLCAQHVRLYYEQSRVVAILSSLSTKDFIIFLEHILILLMDIFALIALMKENL